MVTQLDNYFEEKNSDNFTLSNNESKLSIDHMPNKT